MKTLTLIFALFCLTTKSQDYCIIYVGSSDTTQVKQLINYQVKAAKKRQMVDSISYSISSDTLFARLHSDTYGITYKFTFNRDLYNKKRCDYQEVIYDCSPCSIGYLEDYMKFYKFKKTSKETYLSKLPYKCEMTVFQTKENKSCMTLKFKYVNLTEKKYKLLYKSLK